MVRFREWNLKRTLAIVAKISEPLADSIASAPDEPWIVPVLASNGWPNLMIKEGARLRTIYDMEDPRSNAREISAQYQCDRHAMNIVIGMGLGYLTNILCRRAQRGHKIVIIEPSAHMLRLAFSLHDFSQPLLDGRLSIAMDDKGAASIISVLDSMQPYDGFNLIREPYTTMRPDEYLLPSNAVMHTINAILCNVGTVSGSGLLMAENDIRSMPYLIRSRGVAELRDVFKGKPAVCVATGPSLDKNVFRLIEARDRVVIIAVAQALRPLLAYGIKPDFITTVDFGETNIGHFRGLMNHDDIPLVCISRAYADLVRHWSGPKFVVGNPMPDHPNSTQAILEKKGFLDTGGSVSHMNMTFALSLGCDPVILIGQDLAWTNRSHTPLADESGNVYITDNQQLIWDVKDERSNLKGQPYNQGNPVEVPGFYGRPVMTNRGLLSFLNTFQAFAAIFGKDRTLINATEGGARIDGFNHMTLDAALAKYAKCSAKINRKPLHEKFTDCDDADELMKKAEASLASDIGCLKTIIRECVTTLKEHKKIWRIIKSKSPDRKALDEALYESQKHGKDAQEESKKLPLMTLALFGVLRRIASKDFEAKKNWAALMHGKKDLVVRTKRADLIYKECLHAARRLLPLYRNAHATISRYLVTGDRSLLHKDEDYIPRIDDAEMFFLNGNWARPYLDAVQLANNFIEGTSDEIQAVIDKAVKMRNESINRAREPRPEEPPEIIEFYDIMHENRKLGQKMKFNDCLKLLRRAWKLVKDLDGFDEEKENAKWGLATTLSHLKRYKESDRLYEELITQNPNKAAYVFEHGLNRIYQGDVTGGSKIIAPILEKVDRYDYFLLRIGDMNMEMKNHAFAESAYRTYLRSFPNDYDGWLKLHYALVQQGKDGAEALERWKVLRIAEDELPKPERKTECRSIKRK